MKYKLTRPELIDLVRFMSELGKPGPYAATTARIVRRWETLQPTEQSYKRLTRTSDTQTIADDQDVNWLPAYSSVAGSLPLQDILDFTFNKRLGENTRKVGFVRCRLNVTSAGSVGLSINNVKGLQMWVDGQPMDARDRQELQLAVGEHRVTFSVDLLAQREPLRVELFDAAGSKAQAQFVTGK